MPWNRILAHAAERLAAASPFAVVEELESVFREVDPGARIVVRLADYRLAELRPVTAGPTGEETDGAAPQPVRIEASDLGRVFVTQRPGRPAGDHGTIVAPVTVRGDRVGVLELTSAGPLTYPDDAPDRLLRVATLLGQALLAAEQVTDAYRSARRAGSLSLAAEIQWDRLPGRSLDAGYATLAAQLEPAHQVVGDAYDWVVDRSGLSALLVDGSGYGTQAAGNTAFTISAVRNARREGADLAGMARLADQALFARFGGTLSASAALLDLDPVTLDLHLVPAGACVALLASRTSVRRLELAPQPPLGAEEDHPYAAQAVRLRPGDRLVVASDGLTGARVHRQLFGDRLERVVQSYRLLGTAELVRAVIRDLMAFHGGELLADDAVVLCLDIPSPP